MRIPVFSRRSNPSIDPPILRKSKSYALAQVDARLADWVDPGEPARGIIAREYLPSRKALPAEKIETINFVPGLKEIPAKMEKNPTLPRIQIKPLLQAAPEWDWVGA